MGVNKLQNSSAFVYTEEKKKISELRYLSYGCLYTEKKTFIKHDYQGINKRSKWGLIV